MGEKDATWFEVNAKGLLPSDLTGEARGGGGGGRAHSWPFGGKTEAPLEIRHQALAFFPLCICRTAPPLRLRSLPLPSQRAPPALPPTFPANPSPCRS